MTEDQAIGIARSFARQLSYALDLDAPTVHRIRGERVNRLYGRGVYPSDSWIVHFPKLLPPGVTEDPSTVVIEILEATGQVRETFVDMPPDWPRPADGK